MFTFLSQFYDENSTIFSVTFCLTLLLWIYFVLSDFFTNENQIDITLKQKKLKSSKIFKEESLCKGVAWINVPIECNRFSISALTNLAERFIVSEPLIWKGFANKPIRMHFQNTGNDVRMTATYETGNIPFISSGAIGAKFSFKAIRFLCNHRASKIQHSIEMCSSNNVAGRTIAMEMQLLAENKIHSMPIRFLIFSWFFVVENDNKSKNYSLEPLIKRLKYIRLPNTMKTIRKPFPLDRIVYESAGNYYGYHRNCTTKLYDDDDTSVSYHQLIEANHLIPIGITQLREFHKLAHHNECAVNESVRIENHSSNAHHQNQINEKEFEPNVDERRRRQRQRQRRRCKMDRDEQQAQHSAVQSMK